MNNWHFIGLLLLFSGLGACADQESTGSQSAHFRLVEWEESGLDFSNDLNPTEDWNIIDYLYYYNGAGVSAGDIDNDGLPDLFFTANEGGNKLYRNLGNLKFEDITEKSGIGPGGWSTGTTMADVNGDGWLDVYVCQVGRYRGRKEKNLLYINNGDGSFTESAAAYGLDFSGLSTQAAFFDYDLDGDLDMYLLNHSVHSVNSYGPSSLRMETDPLAGDRLYRNDLDENGRFTDVTRQAGIYTSQLGYGLGLAITDYNNDGWPDIYVSNDFHENDYLYRNMGDGTFREIGEEAFGHTSRYSMGNETADLNQDGQMDILTLDMLPGDPAIIRKSAAEDRAEVNEIKENFGYRPQYVRNALQINSGKESFSDLAVMAGIYATDWSWGALVFDMENDGYQDVYITNGIVRRPNDLDYIQYLAHAGQKNREPADKEMTENMPVLKIANYAYHNLGELHFADSTAAYGLEIPSFSNGAAYADLDLDGDLDLIVNNINDRAFLLENTSASGNFLQVVLRDSLSNRFGIGARVEIYANGRRNTHEMYTTRGFMSSVEPVINSGLGEAATADSIKIYWPGRGVQLLTDVPVNQRLEISPGNLAVRQNHIQPGRFGFTKGQTIHWKHEENDFKDYKREPLIPYAMSMEGPAVAVADVNGDGKEDIYLGGSHGNPGTLFMQDERGFLKLEVPVFEQDRLFEDVDAEFLDVDGDGDMDLYVVSGGNEYPEGDERLADRLYINEAGTFQTRELFTPAYNGAAIAVSDINNDGFPDVFVGNRSVPGNYGAFTESCILMNDGKGKLTKLENFSLSGMVTDAVWFDADNDGDEDLCVVGDWSAVRLFINDRGNISENAQEIPGTTGWWRSVSAGDLNGDGLDDLIAGNAGLNMKIRASLDNPVELYLNDIDGNGQQDPVLFYWLNGQVLPFASKDELDRQVPVLKKKFSSYEEYSKASDIPGVIKQLNPEGAVSRKAETFASICMLNTGDGTFEVSELPGTAQWSAVQDIFISENRVNGVLPVILGGNSYEMNIGIGRLDAMPGTILSFDRNGEPIPAGNFMELGIRGDFRAIRPIMVGDTQQVLLVRNDGEAEMRILTQQIN